MGDLSAAMTASHDAEHFRRLYARSTDPWAFRTSAYEKEKYRQTIAALGERRFRSGFEPGCSIGVLTRMLAERCDNLLAADIIEEPLHTARAFCGDLPSVRFVRMRIPAEWPDGRFDLIVLSEVLYFLSPRDIAAVAAHALATLDAEGVVLLANWRGRGNDPCGGDEAATIFLSETHPRLHVTFRYHTPSYRIDLLVRHQEQARERRRGNPASATTRRAPSSARPIDAPAISLASGCTASMSGVW
jgi:Nodulation protein S (NodS)